MDTIVTVTEMKNRMSELLERASQGDRVIIRRRGKRSLALVRLDNSLEREESALETPVSKRQKRERASAQLGDRFRLPRKQQERLETLGRKSKQDTLTEAEREELLQLLHEMEEKSRERARALGALL